MRRWLPIIFVLLVLFACAIPELQIEMLEYCTSVPFTSIMPSNPEYLCLSQSGSSDLGISVSETKIFQYGISGHDYIEAPFQIPTGKWEEYDYLEHASNDNHQRNVNLYPSIRGMTLMAYDELWAPLDHLIEKWDFRDLNAIILAEGFSTENINDHTKCSYGELLLLGPDGNHDRNCRAQSQIGENTYTLQNDKVDVNQFDKSGDIGVEAGEISHLKTGLTSADLPHHIPIVLKCGAEEEGLFWSTSRSTWPDENPNKIPAPIYAPDEYCEDGYGSDSKCNDGNDEKGGDEISNKDPCSEYTCAGYKDRGGDEIDTQSVVMQDVNIDGTRYINGYICTNTGGSNYEWVSFIELNEQNDGDDNDLSHPIFDCDDDNPFVWYPHDFFVEIIPSYDGDWEINYGMKSQERSVCGDGRQDYCDYDTLFKGSAKTMVEDVLSANDMLDSDGNFRIDDGDDCDLNAYACENNCLRKDGNCDYLTKPNDIHIDTSETEGGEDDTEEYGEDEFDYGDIEVGAGFCCGASLDDMGSVLEDSDQNYLCMKNDDPFISMNGDSKSKVTDLCNNEEWCWLNSLDLPFEVLTVKQEDGFKDYVSNYGDWNVCNETNLGNLEYPILRDGLDDSNFFKTSRFNCLQTGSNYMFAECVSDPGYAESHETRVRTMGQSRLAFNESGTSNGYFSLQDYGIVDGHYGQIGDYEKKYGVDLSEYDHLELFVKFEDIINYYPLKLNLSVKTFEMNDGDSRVLYDQNILGYSDFPYLVEGEYIQLKIPIGDWIDVAELRFNTYPEAAHEGMDIKALQATKQDEEELYCSGQQVNVENSYAFIEGIDESADSNSDIDSMDICKTLFGEDAWFGYNSGSNIEVDEISASCCGNKPAEYYIGETQEDLDPRACFNSEVIYEGERAANIQFNVKYNLVESTVTKINWENPSDSGQYSTYNTGYVTFDEPYYTSSMEGKWGVIIVGEDQQYIGKEEFEDGNNYLVDLPDGYYWYDVYERSVIRSEIYYYDMNLLLTLQLIHEHKEIDITYETTTGEDTYTLPCLEDECVYALPGEPPYEITNNFPGLYDLYFVVGSNEEEQYLITEEDQYFSMYGNILARHVSKNVLMTNETFFSCEVPDYYFETGYENYGEQGSRCDVQTGYVCSPQDADSLINTWSNLDLDKIGYTEVIEFVEDMEFAPRTCGASDPCDVEDLAYYVKPVPGRNLVPNADFYLSDGNRIEDWIMYDGQFDTDSLPFRENESVVVNTGFKLKSSKIAVHENSSYTVSSSGTCSLSVNGYNKEGDLSELSPTFNGAAFEYVELVFEGSECTVTAPYLSTGSSLSEDFDARYPFRSGAACCPEGACWNGYICVEDMASYTFMTEGVGEEDYRCINGDWYNLPPLYDWNGDEIGYCESEGQCFVTSSLSEGITENATYSDFYNGEYPACINDGEYIFDHLCQDGEWSSRTKFVASSLLNYADDEDHILYCTNVRDSLLDYKEGGYNYANYIEGESTTVVEETASLDEAFNGSLTGNTTISICYPELTVSETGRRLIPDEDNTCVNNVCTVRYGAGDWKTMWGTSVNIDPRDSQSLFVPLGISGSDTETFCDGDNDSWVDCNGNIWFQDSMDTIIYTQEEIGMSNTVTESIVSFLSNLFGTDQLEESEDYLEEATNFNKVYIASVDDYTIRAIEEVDGDQETIVAEYTGFETPVCDYVYNVNPSMVYVEQFPTLPEYLVNCTVDGDTSTIVTGTNRDFWWSQLTGMLRLPGVE